MTSPSAPTSRGFALAYLLAAATAAPMLSLLWLAPVVPAHAAPEQLATWAILRGLLAGHDPFLAHFELNPLPAPWLQLGFLATFWDILGPVAAQKLFLTLCVLGLPLGAMYLRRGLERAPTPRAGLVSALLASLLGPSWCFFMGLFDFLAALPLLLLAVGTWIRYLREPTRRRAVGLFLTFPLIGLADPTVLAATGLLAALVALYHTGRRRALMTLLGLGAAGWGLLAAVLANTLGPSPAVASPPAWRMPFADALGGFVMYTTGGPTPLLALLGVPLLAALGLVLWAGRRFDLARRPAALGLLLGVFAVALVYLLAPFQHDSGSFVQPRLALAVLVLVACLGGLDWTRTGRLMVTVLSLTAVAAVAAPLARSYLWTARAAAEIAAAAATVPIGALVLPIIFEPESTWADPWLQPLERAGSYVTVFADGVTPYHDARQPLADPVLYRRGGRRLPAHPPLYAGSLDACQPEKPIEACFERRRWLHDTILFQLRHFDGPCFGAPRPT